MSNDSTLGDAPGIGTTPIDMVVADGVAWITLNRPEKRNAVTYEMWLALAEFCDRAAVDPLVRVLVVTGNGDHFCAGADVSGMAGTSADDYAAANERADRALTAFPKPSIAFIRGSCVGGGAQIATACDLRLADATARFGITPARLGILYPSFAVERTVSIIGAPATKHLLYSAEIVDADRALRIGLIDELLEPDDAQKRLRALTTLLATRRSLLTQMASKAIIDDVVATGSVSGETVETWNARQAHSDDAREGITAFLERRDPQFTWTPPSDDV